ncbi:MAG: DUF2357 domain-containing protein [Clostridiales bacterium]|nr:DUF2357 domain-containing protein [Clostridiales bacterium]
MRLEEEKFLFNRIFDDFYAHFPNGASVSDLINAFTDKKIILQFGEKEGTKVIDEECVEEIKKVVPFIQRIVEKPRSFIKSIEEKVLVATAKRINSNAIMHLGRDSNDWYARTFLTVKPKNIVSDINEETIDLYENRFVKTLIDRIIQYVVARRIKLENLFGRVEDENIRAVLDSTRNSFVRIQANSDILIKALSKDGNVGASEGYLSHIREDLEEVRQLERKIINLRYSDFYNKLRKCRKVSNPIAKTNIIMFDSNYNRCYKLWEYLNSEHQEEDYSLEEYEEKQYASYYYAYVVFNVVASLHNSGYNEQNNPTIDYDSKDMLTISNDMVWSKKDTIVNMRLEPSKSKIVFSLLLDERKNKWDVFEIYTDYTNFEGKSRSQIEDITTEIVNNLVKREKRDIVSSKYCFVSLDINACSASNDFGETLYRRLFNIGDNYSKEEVDLASKAYYKTGIQILSPLDIRYNFLHIQRIINSHILRNKDFTTMPSVCPLCGSDKVRSFLDHIDCYECGHRISTTKCSNCGEQRLLWVKYTDDAALKKKEITDIVKERPYYYQLMKYETIMGQYAISSFRLEEEITGWKLKSICPKCGVLLGDT